MLFSLHAFATPAGDLPLMPWPQQVEQPAQGGKLVLNHQLTLQISGDYLAGAQQRWLQRIARQTGWELQPHTEQVAHPTISVIIANAVDRQPLPDSDESYQLEVTAQGVKLHASTRFGAMRGMETLLQLIQNDSDNSYIPLVTIHDRPRFPWRGVLIDSARHFMPLETIKRQIDGIAAARMNVFHWHLTDDQGWRFASSHYPQLQQQASDGLFYTQDEMKMIVRYAADRGIRVVPELDVPGHASAIAVAMPELISAPGPYSMERGWGVFKPLLDPTNEEVYRFVDTLVAEMAEIFPDPYLHIGGDEVDASQWQESAKIQQFMQQHQLKDEHALQAYFNARVEKILEKHQRQMVGWDEIYHPDLPRSILIQSWQGQDALGAVAKDNFRGILSTGFYLDQPQAAAYHYRNEVYPHGLDGADQLQSSEQAQSWQFSMPRLKGSAVNGSFTLIDGQQGWRGFIDFSGKSRRMVRDIRWLAPDQLTFSVDTWMGEVQPVVTLNGDKLTGYMLVGNVRYPASGSKLAQVPQGTQPVVPDEKQQQENLLGGEAALWAENINASVLDIKLWPRAFAVAERLWSAKDVTDEDNMYQRLAAVDRWSAVSVGLQQHTQTQSQMIRLANSSDIVPLQIFSEALEQAQYYTRQHLKFQAGHYHLFEPLNRLADALPAESSKVRALDKQVDALIANRGDQQAAQAIRQQLRRWQNNIPQVMPLIERNYQLKALQPVASQLAQISQIGIELVASLESHRAFGAHEVAQMQATLDKAAQTQDEVVIALVYPLEKLLRASK
ncbi:beta-N-acetylhexosaminidase [Erwiniaceae bacterium BAC15a-03b]|uniref:N-acetyl-beta-glucosaminidase n=2 Tax=Winslowiella arboricola TaxID=2978220 RepID=A0A9J6PJN1_9GAMM|nr:family 20 glycosylhydrolase [Winslowiella arboricola]MCU5773375.1 beta-N-acetylhexosaminidase [Winslowiella arboricola]MCU5776699.1 beta-N-acetylhexosaminidase [Winslowiella arboricola]